MRKKKVLFITPIENENVKNLCQYPNVGDIALTIGARNLFQDAYPFCDITIESVNLDLDDNIDYINSFDYLVLAGGGILHSTMTKSHFLLKILPETVDKIKAKLIINSVGINLANNTPDISSFGYNLINKLFDKAIYATVRDSYTKDKLKRDIPVVLDSAFYLKPETKERFLNVYGLVYHKCIHNILEYIIINNQDKKFILIYHTPDLKNKSEELMIYPNVLKQEFENNPLTIMKLYSSINGVLGHAYHSMIFAILTRTPFLNLVYNIKNSALIEDLDLNNCSIDVKSNYEDVNTMFKKLKAFSIYYDFSNHLRNIKRILGE